MRSQRHVAVVFASAAIASAQQVYRLTNCYSYSNVIYPLDLQGTYSNNDLESCANDCAVFGYQYFGVSTGTNCYCGNTLYDDDTSPECFSSAAIPCPGAPAELCGADSNMAIYGNPAIIGDCPTTSIDGLGSPCFTVTAGATPSAGTSASDAPSSTPTPASSTSSSSEAVPSTSASAGSRTGTQSPSATDIPLSSSSSSSAPTSAPSDSSSDSASAAPTSYTTSFVSTTDAAGNPTSVPTLVPVGERTGSQTETGSSPATTTETGFKTTASVCSPTTLRSALVDGSGAVVTVFPVATTVG